MNEDNDIRLCDTKYHDYLELALQQYDPEERRLLQNIAWSWSRVARQIERHRDKRQKALNQ